MAYEIDININGDATDLEATNSVNGGGEGKKSKANDNFKRLGQYIAGQTIQPIIQNVRTQVSQNIGMITGSEELQQRINFGLKTFDTGLSLFNAGKGGAILTSSMGLSAGLGAGLGIALAVANIGLNIAFNQAQINIKNRLEKAEINQLNQRGGYAFNKSRQNGSF